MNTLNKYQAGSYAAQIQHFANVIMTTGKANNRAGAFRKAASVKRY